MVCSKNVAIIVLNWNGWKDTIECLNSLRENNYDNFTLILIDNASSDSSVNNIRKWLYSNGQYRLSCKSVNSSTQIHAYQSFWGNDNKNKHCRLLFLENSENLGFAAGCNQGIRLACHMKADYVWLLNNDTVIEPDSLYNLVCFLEENSHYAMVTPQIRLYNRPDRVWNCGGRLTWYGARRYYFANKPVSTLPQKKSIDVTFVTGCALLAGRKLFSRLGGLSERFFFGEEDFELSLRLKKRRYKVACCLHSIIFHKVGASIDHKSDGAVLNKVYIYYLNRFINLRGHYPLFLWKIWRNIYFVYISLLLKSRHHLTGSKIFRFKKKLFYESIKYDGVDKEKFEALITVKNHNI